MRAIPDSVELAVLGGGINGAAVASLAAAQGYRTALFEKGDFASGTSSKSSKLIHGGIRYLETGRFGLVRESLAEREVLLRGKPHLVRPLPFLLPSYGGDTRSAGMLRAGMVLYDLLASTSSLPRPEWLSPGEALERAPALRRQGLRGSGLYYDTQVDDARLVLEEILAAEESGATCANYCTVTELSENASGCVLNFRDELTQTSGSVRARAVLVAAGPWTDRIRAELLGYGRALLRPTRGTHVMLRQPLSNHAVVGASPVDGRIFFAIPWRGMALVGTTDDDDDGDPDLVAPTAEDVRYLLESAQGYFPEHKLTPPDVVGAFAGLRPLIATPGGATSAVSREADIVQAGHMVFVVGGKLTTYRAVARRAFGAIAHLAGEPQRAPVLVRTTASAYPPNDERALRRKVESCLVARGVPPATAGALASRYRVHLAELVQLVSDEPSLAEPLCAGCPTLRLEVAFSVLHERAVTLGDVLARRLGIIMGAPYSVHVADSAAQIMAKALSWTDDRRTQELAHLTKAVP